MNNYYPISVISKVAKAFDGIAYDQLYTYLVVNDFIYKYQSGFHTTHSAVTALREATSSWAYNVDRGKVNAVVLLDLKKAFDTVNHEILLSKLRNGICDNEYSWMDLYLDNRRQRCSVNKPLPRSCSLSCGVPQGTILGPLLFLLCINDLSNCLSNCQSRMYVDCIHLTYAGFSADNIQSCLNDDLVNVSNWLIANKLALNMFKTELMLIGSR